MGFQRANWHSGLTYQQQCPDCKTIVRYTDEKLDFRPWFADGFIYCPVCKKPLRHNENMAINKKKVEPRVVDFNDSKPGSYVSNFCSKCGHKFNKEDSFCTECGSKRT